MVYTEIKTIKGRKYRYERISYRVGKQVKHKSKYLGPVAPLNQRRDNHAGRKPKLKVRELTKVEDHFIKQHLKSSKSFMKDRAKIISLSNGSNTVKQICEKLDFHRPKIEKIIKGFNKEGLKIFERKKNPGKPRRISKEERALILQYLNTSPEKLGQHFNNWSHTRLSEYAKLQGIKVSSSQVGRIIKQDEIKYKKKVPHLYSNDPDFSKKKLVIDELKINRPSNSEVFSFDEKAKIAIKEYGGYAYTKKKKIKVSAKQKVRGLLEMPAAINIHTGEIHCWFYDWKNSFIVIECFEDLTKRYPDKDIYVILDCWKAHTSLAIRVWNFFHPRFHLIFTPTNASWINMIERVFSKLNKDILQNSNFQTVREAMARISNYFEKETRFMAWGT